MQDCARASMQQVSNPKHNHPYGKRGNLVDEQTKVPRVFLREQPFLGSIHIEGDTINSPHNKKNQTEVTVCAIIW